MSDNLRFYFLYISCSIDNKERGHYNGNKKRRFSFHMKEKIICASIESLRQEGLRFSVDTLACKLNVSKKTIYKYFPDKETLALAIYERYYNDAKEQAQMLITDDMPSLYFDLLAIYYDAKVMIRRDIFNKYKFISSKKQYTY